MSTIGHPLADLCNFITPFFTASQEGANAHKGFMPNATPGLPTSTQIVHWYAEVAGWDPAPELSWGMAFNIFRSAAVCQGIAARIAKRQASSGHAKRYADTRDPLAEYAWELSGQAREDVGRVRSKSML
jgi:acyl-CoA dehydrogenase